MKIILENIIFSIQKIGGISVVWFELVKRLNLDNDFDVKFIEYKNFEKNLLRNSIEIDSKKLMKLNKLFFNFRRYFNPEINYHQPYIFHSSSYRISKNKNAINFITVHDFLYFKNDWQGYKIWLIRKTHQFQMKRAIKNASFLICISNSTKNDLINYFPEIELKKIKVIYNGVSDDYYPIIDIDVSTKSRFNKNDYCIFVGSRSNYKNFKFVVESLSILNKNLLIIGKQLNENEAKFVESYLETNQFEVMSNVSNSELNLLYNSAICLIYPSSFEGFGIPIIEAQKAGCPVIAYNKSSIPEVIGDTPLLINELTIDNLNYCFKLLENEITKNQIIQQGLKNAERFSWDKMYTEIKKIYKEATQNK